MNRGFHEATVEKTDRTGRTVFGDRFPIRTFLSGRQNSTEKKTATMGVQALPEKGGDH